MATRHERLNNKALNDEHSRILRALMARSDNRRCVDCRKKGMVKSADLDTWTPEQIENMIKWGNGS
ncbi:hypothetical protein HDU84_005089 [Entophlyctis sp. JEL0112]|nr:hypothetical protein HDU84_005089 [Entophlyctis sp. JEL0112]